MLNTDLHNLNNPFKMTRSIFVERVKGILPKVKDEVLREIYNSIKSKQIKLIRTLNSNVSDTEKIMVKRSMSARVSGSVSANNSIVSLQRNTMSLQNYSNYSMALPLSAVSPKGDVFFEGSLRRKSVFLKLGKRPFSKSYRQFFVCLSLTMNFFRPAKDIKSKLKLLDCLDILHGLASPLETSSRSQLKAEAEADLCNKFSLRTAIGGLFVFDAGSLESAKDWIFNINLIAAVYSARPMPMASSSDPRQFSPPKMPAYPASLEMFDAKMLNERCKLVEEMLDGSKTSLHELIEEINAAADTNESSKSSERTNRKLMWDQKLHFLNWEIKKYQIYLNTLRQKLRQLQQE